ncbi:phage shock protein A [Tumebacillus algifaecis]|uniref:Phage shock protein A n=1 Tax=Tumebacillus algifaecis TaxID=1214604 RepID=A0A223D007_9BACL|nr:PspA/IM30 family protein [Tumebacillus algifaecis]ASS74871.1 phage shock protein A [Tumebacillus algifaecis]
MALFKRLRDLTLANINSLLDKAEDPVKMLDQYLRDMEEDIQDAESAVAKQIALEKKLQQQYQEAKELAEKREAQALQALEAGNEDLARRALIDKKAMSEKAADFKVQYDGAKLTADNLRGKLGEMKDQLGEMKNKRDTLKARAEAAKAQKQINQTLSGLGSNNAASGFSRMEDRVLQLEAEAEASTEMSGSKSLDREFAELEKKNTSDIDAELEALKAKLKK